MSDGDGDEDSAAAVVRDYYGALRVGDPLEPFFRADESTVKFGISEALYGYDAVAEALQEQTETTDSWSVESSRLDVDQRESFATVVDEVTMAWTDTESGDRKRFDTRWSGTLVPAESEGADRNGEGGTATTAPDWQFASMHVSSAPDDL